MLKTHAPFTEEQIKPVARALAEAYWRGKLNGARLPIDATTAAMTETAANCEWEYWSAEARKILGRIS